eukprot:1902995-Amphidinium_carterae.1
MSYCWAVQLHCLGGLRTLGGHIDLHGLVSVVEEVLQDACDVASRLEHESLDTSSAKQHMHFLNACIFASQRHSSSGASCGDVQHAAWTRTADDLPFGRFAQSCCKLSPATCQDAQREHILDTAVHALPSRKECDDAEVMNAYVEMPSGIKILLVT